MPDTDKCPICDAEVVWYDLEEHIEFHYEDERDNETEKRITQDKEEKRT